MSDLIVYKADMNVRDRNNSHQLMREFVNAIGHPVSVLEVGCASGYFGHALQADGHEVTGVEPYLPAAHEAQASGLKVFQGSLDDYLGQHPDARYEVITFGDVLEHLTDPERALRDSLQALKADGRIVCSVPNVAHVSVRAMLLQGRWEYQKTGLLDATHLRFFSREQFEALVERVGLRVERVQATRVSAQVASDAFGLALDPAFIRCVEGLCVLDPELDAFQYVYTLARHLEAPTAGSASKVPRTLLLVTDLPASSPDGPGWNQSLRELANQALVSVTVSSPRQARRMALTEHRAVIFMPQGLSPDWQALAARCRQVNVPVAGLWWGAQCVALRADEGLGGRTGKALCAELTAVAVSDDQAASALHTQFGVHALALGQGAGQGAATASASGPSVEDWKRLLNTVWTPPGKLSLATDGGVLGGRTTHPGWAVRLTRKLFKRR